MFSVFKINISVQCPEKTLGNSWRILGSEPGDAEKSN
jgi:hypothetical protein